MLDVDGLPNVLLSTSSFPRTSATPKFDLLRRRSRSSLKSQQPGRHHTLAAPPRPQALPRGRAASLLIHRVLSHACWMEVVLAPHVPTGIFLVISRGRKVFRENSAHENQHWGCWHLTTVAKIGLRLHRLPRAFSPPTFRPHVAASRSRVSRHVLHPGGV